MKRNLRLYSVAKAPTFPDNFLNELDASGQTYDGYKFVSKMIIPADATWVQFERHRADAVAAIYQHDPFNNRKSKNIKKVSPPSGHLPSDRDPNPLSTSEYRPSVLLPSKTISTSEYRPSGSGPNCLSMVGDRPLVLLPFESNPSPLTDNFLSIDSSVANSFSKKEAHFAGSLSDNPFIRSQDAPSLSANVSISTGINVTTGLDDNEVSPAVVGNYETSSVERIQYPPDHIVNHNELCMGDPILFSIAESTSRWQPIITYRTQLRCPDSAPLPIRGALNWGVLIYKPVDYETYLWVEYIYLKSPEMFGNFCNYVWTPDICAGGLW